MPIWAYDHALTLTVLDIFRNTCVNTKSCEAKSGVVWANDMMFGLCLMTLVWANDMGLGICFMARISKFYLV